MIKKYTLAQAKKDLPKRSRQSNKTHGGKVLIIAGSQDMWGAAVLSATAAARTGAGYVYLKNTKPQFPIVKHPDFLVLSSLKNTQAFQSIVIGPGLKDSQKILADLKKLRHHPRVIVDASALDHVLKLKKIPATWILTPHEGELARMLKTSSAAIKHNRLKAVLLAHKKFGCVVLLKGHHTLVADQKVVYQITSGNAALGKAGTGDVLSGMIGAFLSQNVPATRAACLAAYIHGAMADDWIRQKKDVLSLMASDLIDHLPQKIYQIRN